MNPVETNPSDQATSGDRIECPAKKDPAVRLFIIAALLLAIAVWCLLDMHNYPKPDPFDLNKYLKYAFNHFLPIGLIPAALVLVIRGVVTLKRHLVADAEGIGYVGKEKIPWSNIERLDAASLQDKGMLDLYTRQGRKLTLDGWKLENFQQLVALVEKHVSPGGSGKES